MQDPRVCLNISSESSPTVGAACSYSTSGLHHPNLAGEKTLEVRVIDLLEEPLKRKKTKADNFL